MLYKLYISKTDPKNKLSDVELDTIFKGFQEIYDMYNVKIVGAWRNAEDPNEDYLITAYRDTAHYSDAVAKMRENKRYKELTELRRDSVKSIKVTTLITLPGSPIRE